jgi:hypothetical protein
MEAFIFQFERHGSSRCILRGYKFCRHLGFLSQPQSAFSHLLLASLRNVLTSLDLHGQELGKSITCSLIEFQSEF